VDHPVLRSLAECVAGLLAAKAGACEEFVEGVI
jgi:hypothetical protein